MTSSDSPGAGAPSGAGGTPAMPRNPFDPVRRGIATAAVLVPALAAGVWFHGARFLIAIPVSYACGAAVELGFSRVRRKIWRPSWSLLPTGLILPLILPPATPLWMVGLGTAFGVFFGEEVFGGEGHNLFSPALVGKCFLLLSWPSTLGEAVKATLPVVEEGASRSALEVLVGPGAGGPGEACGAAVLVGAAALVILGIASWRTCLATLVSAAAMGCALWLAGGEAYAGPAVTLLSGGFLFSACFIAADAPTSPGTGAGKLVFGCLVGVLAVLIRSFSAYGTYTEAAMFAVLLGELFAPAIDDAVVALGSRSGGKSAERAGDAEGGGGSKR